MPHTEFQKNLQVQLSTVQLFINYCKFYRKQYPLPTVSRLASQSEQWLIWAWLRLYLMTLIETNFSNCWLESDCKKSSTLMGRDGSQFKLSCFCYCKFGSDILRVIKYTSTRLQNFTDINVLFTNTGTLNFKSCLCNCVFCFFIRY